MTGPHPAGTYASAHRGLDLAPLSAGVRYRVAKPFRDAEGDRHRAGSRWTYLGSAIDGDRMTLWVSRDDGREWSFPLAVSQQMEGEVLATLGTYLVEDAPPTVAEQVAEILDAMRTAVERSEPSLHSGLDVDDLAQALSVHIDSLRADGRLAPAPSLDALLVPTGALQETSIDNGWGDLYIDLTTRFDALRPRLDAEYRRRHAARSRAEARSVRRRRTLRTVGLWGTGLALAVWAAHTLGVLDVLLGLAAVVVAIVAPFAVGLAWLFSDGLFSTRTPSDLFRAATFSPGGALGTAAFAVADLALLAWGVHVMVRAVGG